MFFLSLHRDFNIASGDGTPTPIPAFQIRGGTGSDVGNVGIGDYGTLTSPKVKLYLFSTGDVDFRMKNTTIGSASTEGCIG